MKRRWKRNGIRQEIKGIVAFASLIAAPAMRGQEAEPFVCLNAAGLQRTAYKGDSEDIRPYIRLYRRRAMPIRRHICAVNGLFAVSAVSSCYA